MKFFIKKSVLPLTIFICVSRLSALTIHLNHIGYELKGPKTFVVECSTSINETEFSIINDQVDTVYYGGLGKSCTVPGWKGRNFKAGSFSDFQEPGKYQIVCGSEQSNRFEIGKNLLFHQTAQAAADFFNDMRNKHDDREVLFFNHPEESRDVHGGWNDATGDMGKYLSHLSYANYMNPQQIPMVVWSLLRSWELNPKELSETLLAEAAYGADYLMRTLDDEGYFYMIVFDRWGWDTNREICTWIYNPDPGIPDYDWMGFKTVDWHAGMREGGGMAVAALAKVASMEISGNYHPNQYLAGAKKAYAHLKQHNTEYCDNGQENIIDDYCALMAATELYRATNDESYKSDAAKRAVNLISRMSSEGWFRSDEKGRRPFYHAAEEGLPLLALVNYMEIDNTNNDDIIPLLQRSMDWYLSISREGVNPFNYVKEYYAIYTGSGSGSNLALNRPAAASSVQEPNTADKAFDGIGSNSRWSSGEPFNVTPYEEWLYVDLEKKYDIEKVVLRWEAAYGTEYKIQLSSNGSSWKDVFHETSGDGSIDEITISPVQEARYVRMYGLQKTLEWGGYSLYEFEVYGEDNGPIDCKISFFQQHRNETGYWWQGENARIASLSTAFLASAITVDPNFRISPTDPVSAIAVSQIDWILGKNPFGVCMMHGFGNKNYPDYPGKPGYSIPNVKGGICNGITSDTGNSDDITWMPYHESSSSNWRWIEQWLPHNAWYLLAVSTLNNILNMPPTAIHYEHGQGGSRLADITVYNKPCGNVWVIITGMNENSQGKISIYNVMGRQLIEKPINKERCSIPFNNHADGIYLFVYKDKQGNSIKKPFFFIQ
ncbi:glycoside hydrolase family 9 protein [Fibrobacterota bacterium]